MCLCDGLPGSDRTSIPVSLLRLFLLSFSFYSLLFLSSSFSKSRSIVLPQQKFSYVSIPFVLWGAWTWASVRLQVSQTSITGTMMEKLPVHLCSWFQTTVIIHTHTPARKKRIIQQLQNYASLLFMQVDDDHLELPEPLRERGSVLSIPKQA